MNVYEFLKSPTPDLYHTLPPVVIDIETTNLHHGNSLVDENRIVLASVWDEGSIKTYENDEFSFPTDVIDRVEGDVFLVGHNIKFDLRWLVRAGLDITRVLVWDTMLAEKVGLGNNPALLPLDLGSVAERRGFQGKEPIVDKLIKEGVCPSSIPRSLLRRRCEYDVGVTYKIFKQQLEELTANNKLGVVLTRCLLTPVLADIETKGLHLSKERVLAAWEEATKEYTDVIVELRKIADINWNSPKQKAEILYTTLKFKQLRRYGKPLTTPTGNPLTNIDTVRQLTATTKRQRVAQELLLQQSKVNAKLTKSLNKFKLCVENGDVLYADFMQHITKTHRLSSNGVFYRTQLQNLARIFKPLVKARHEGWEICDSDGNNLEFRVGIELGGDEQGWLDLADPSFDAHDTSAAWLTREGQPTDRQEAKACTFKPLYGGSSGTKAEQKYYDYFKDRYKGIIAVQEEWKDSALRTGSVVMPWGMEFFFPNTKVTKSGYQTFSTQICNYPVQSFATADIIPITLVYTWHAIKALALQAFINNTVHDSIIIEAPIEEKEKINEILVQAFTEMCYNYIYKVYNINIKTALGVSIKWGEHWSEGEEQSTDVPNTITIEN